MRFFLTNCRAHTPHPVRLLATGLNSQHPYSSLPVPEELLGPTLVQHEVRTLFMGAKRPECKVDHCPLSSAEVYNTRRFTSITHIGLRLQ
jgi:hypothetical protein